MGFEIQTLVARLGGRKTTHASKKVAEEGVLRKGGSQYPPTRKYYENNSLRIIFVIFESCCALEMSRKEKHFQGITRETRK